MTAVNIFRSKIIDYSTAALCIDVTGDTEKLDAFIEIMKPLGIIEMCRTGIVALERERAAFSALVFKRDFPPSKK